MNLPNALTVFRILALPFCAWALFQKDGQDPTWQIIAWSSFFIVGMTDVLDGRIARKRNQISNFGIILDPIADKAFIATALVGLSILGKMPWWVTAVILIREIGVT
ncbi:MAG: CDP-diacylglycerol--glycerol-3-phosphate 3-phosphatidyltransferase, partial [Actinomycetota bacterium]